MKVLHIISGGDKGGAKTHVFTLLSALMEEIDIYVICFTEGVFYREIKNTKIPSMLIKQKYRNDLTIIKELVKHIRLERYNLVHSHGARANFIAMILKLFIKIPIVTTIHSDYRLDFTSSLYKKHVFTFLNRFSLNFMDYYIGISNSFKNMLIERGFKKDKIYTVYNTIDFEREINFCSKEDFSKKHNIDVKNKILVGIIGRFDLVKGHSMFINAAAEILKDRKDVLFLLAGEGVEENNLLCQVKRLGIEDNVIFLGFIDDIFSFINMIDINVLSSYSESFPYVLLEGAIFKKATVSTDVGGIKDLIMEGKTGFIVKAGDYKCLAKKILKFMYDPKLRLKLGSNLYNYAKINFSKENMKCRHINIYNEIINRQKENNKLFDVILSGYYGFENSGDDALLKAVIDSLVKEDKDIKILVLSKKPKKTIEEYRVYSVNRYNFFTIINYMKRSRVFVNGGGSIIQDITSTQSLIYYTFLLKLAKYYGLKIMMYANGIGPITKKYNIKRAAKALFICDYISLREPESLIELNKLGVKNKNVYLSVDPVFTIDKASIDEIDDILILEGIDRNKKYFVVSCRSWKYNELKFIEKISNIINIINKKYGMIPLYIPMNPNDVSILKDIILESKTEHVLLSKVYDVRELLAIINITKLTISMRLHTLIYAVSVNVPIIGLVYDPKVKFFIEYLNEDKYLYTSNLDEEKFMIILDNIEKNYYKIKEKLANEREKLIKLSVQDAKAVMNLRK